MTTALDRTYGPAPPPHELRRLLGRHVPAAVEDMAAEVAARLPGYADAFDRTREFAVREVVDRTVRHFLADLDPAGTDGAAPAADIAALYERIGRQHAHAGHPVGTLRTALGLAGQVARRRLIKDAYRFRWPEATLEALIESTFALIETATAAAVAGYEAAGGAVPQLEQHRARLRDALVADFPARRGDLAELAEAAAWPLPETLAVVALPPGTRTVDAVLPQEVLAYHHPQSSYLVLPAPEPARARRQFRQFRLLRTRGAAVGPAVPLGRGTVSLRWARRAVQLIQRGGLPAAAPLYCVDHLAGLAAAEAGELLGSAAAEAAGPLLALPRRRRDPLLETLFAYLDSGDNAVITAKRLFVHEQTVRYRIRQIDRLTGGALPGAAGRLETMLVLTWLLTAPDG
ncbi:PucR family transcriptional regulator [Streptomyces sp. A7024]|uniref:PucR family transcriptional regulator n=1 Tax=Streptomyces coryli TaxID=1128680 RepID=A0A6G4TZ96_9ACTN|nr:helix-turn-helix domain-containing protein [Streptomyces coryli]NGN64448.1 PucR family transcriptional regulator [Streptomyces coryli]